MSFGASSALDASVLVLNKYYMAVHVISARRAFTLLFKDLAEVVTVTDGYYTSHDIDAWIDESARRVGSKGPDDDFVRTVRFEIEVPRIVRLLSYERVPRSRIKLNRRNILARDGHRCQYCGKRCGSGERSIDHVLPRSRGGTNTWENIVCACIRCNVRKGGRTPREAGMKLLSEPSKPTSSPSLSQKLKHGKYASWQVFLEHGVVALDLK